MFPHGKAEAEHQVFGGRNQAHTSDVSVFTSWAALTVARAGVIACRCDLQAYLVRGKKNSEKLIYIYIYIYIFISYSLHLK